MIVIDGLNDTLSGLKLSTSSIENLIGGYKLIFSQTRRNDIEWKMKLPMFVPPFYDYLKRFNTIPTQEEYYNYYISQNQTFFDLKGLSNEQLEGLRARVYRTYPSLVRDVHFGLTLKEKNFFEEVFYNEVLDIEYGIDLVVSRSSKRLGLNLFTQTSAAQYARQVKQYRPKKSVDFNCIEIPINFRGSKVCGKFFLYSDREISQIVQDISHHV